MNNLGLGIIVSMKDAFTQNAMRIQSAMRSLDESVEAAGERMTRNFDLIQRGAMMVGAGIALLAVPAALVTSTTATQRALGELASVGVRDFRAMENAAESFTNRWSGSGKAEFISAAYDVKSALSNLSDEAVGAFSSMAALTAKATKASTQEMVGTFTTAYGIFKPIMADMSDMEWATAFSGAMAQTVASFKTTGAQMAEAIKNVGATAAASNIPLQEQLAILGQLQTTMPGSEAGTLYKAFVMKAAEAGEKLGLSFIDASGRMKGILPILEEVRRKFPDLSQAAAQVEIKKAFGSDEAVKFLLQMSAGMSQLEANIAGVEQAMQAGTITTERMAGAMNQDVGSYLALVRQQAQNLSEILGRTLLPTVIHVIKGVSRFILTLQDAAKSMPGVTRAVLLVTAALGLALVVVGSVISAIGMVGLAIPAVKAGILALGGAFSGLGATISASFLPVTAIIAGIVIAVFLLKKAWDANLGGIRDAVTGAWRNVKLAFEGIHALISSLSNGTGQMSAELAQKLQAAGLMGFVTTVFRIYHRIREFASGFRETLSAAFGQISNILGPAVSALIDAFREVGKAISGVLAAFGLVTTSADASTFKEIGKALGSVLGIIAKVVAYLLKFSAYGLVFIVRGIALVVKGLLWLGKAAVMVFSKGLPLIYRYHLPLRLLVAGLMLAGRTIRFVWRLFMELPGAISSAFSQIAGFAGRTWDSIRNGAAALWMSLISLAASGVRMYLAPWRAIAAGVTFIWSNIRGVVLRAFGSILQAVSNLVSSAFRSGRSVMTSIADGIRSAVTAPYDAAVSALKKLRKLLPFSDAKEGPLSTLTRSGTAMLEAFSSGIARAADAPMRAFEEAVGRAMRLGEAVMRPSVITGQFALTPVLDGPVPSVSSENIQARPSESTRLLAVTRGSISMPSPVRDRDNESTRSILQAVLNKLDGLAERPIEVSVTTTLDGRKIAQSVYKDMRERKVRNYETE